MRFAQLSTATTLTVDLEERPDAGATFVVYNPQGGEAQASAAATIDAVSTTLAAAAQAGAMALSVASATGITVGRRYLVGGAESAGGERVTVRAVAGTTVTLVRPLRYARASAAAFQSTRVELAVTGSNVATVGRHWRAEVTYTVSTAARSKAVVPFDVVRYVPIELLSLEDVRALDPLIAKRLAEGAWWPDLKAAAWDQLLHRVAAKVDPGALVGTVNLTVPLGYLIRTLVAETAGRDHEPTRALLARRFGEELDAALGAHAVDDDQDGAVERHEGWRRTIVLERG